MRAVLDDQWVGAAEAVTTAQDPAPLGADRPRYAIFRYEGSAADLAPALQIFSELPVKIRAEADVPILRHADAVQPQIVIKQRFGEFSYRPAAGRGIVIDPDWLETHIVTKEIDLLGEVRCHRDFLDLLEKVMALLAQAGPADVVDPAAFLGCFNARTVTGRRDLSRHAWGVAADINFTNAVDGPGSPTAPDLIAVMELFGITSGHDWTIPDPGHFEWVGADFEH